MIIRRKTPLAQDTYNAIADAYAARIDTKAHNAYYERPATLSLLPDVRGKYVLDAGCGPGVYAEWLVAHGASVVALDGNPKMVKLARHRLGKTVRVILANLESPLDFLQDGEFDLVISPLVMDYLKDWASIFNEFYRVLKVGGIFVFSMGHPFQQYDIHRQTSNYFDVELVEYPWTGFGQRVNMPSYRRPMSEVVNPLIATGFTLSKILEPLPTVEFQETAPDDYQELIRNPGFMCLRAVKVN